MRRRAPGTHLSLRTIASSRTHRKTSRVSWNIFRALSVFTTVHMDDVHGRIVAFERLLLPFSNGSAFTTADHVIEFE
jgi:hypothetical protein